MKNYFFIFCVTLVFSGCAVIKTPLNATATGDGKYWIVDEALEYEVDGKQYFVPKGFVTDFASVPRVFWAAFPPCDKYTPAAVVHDYLYWMQFEDCNRICADEILLSAMESSGVDHVTRQSMYRAVQFFGKKAWDDNKVLKEKQHVIRLIPEEFPRPDPNETWEKMEKRMEKEKETLMKI